jgi:hypothetical protein
MGAGHDTLVLIVVFNFLLLALLSDVDTDDMAQLLLVVAQSLFMLLPIAGINGMVAGIPAQLTTAKCTTHAVASLGFVTLIAMFSVKGAALGVKLCSINLFLRMIENVRIYQLHLRYDRPVRKAAHRF